MGTTADKLNYLNSTKSAIKTAIQDKGVAVADSDTFRSYAQKIATIDTKPILRGTALQEDVRLGSLFYSDDYTLKQGTMPENSGKDIILHDLGGVQISKGYYDGTNVARLNDTEKQKLVSSNIKQGVTILGVQGSVVPQATLSGNATASDVLAGKTFYSNSTTKQTGTMPTYSGTTNYINAATQTYTIPAGYHNGTTKVSVADGYACLPDASVWDSDPSNFPPLANIGWVGLPYALAYASRADVYDAWKGQTLPIVVSSTTCTARLVSDNYNGTSGLVFYVTGLPTQYALFSGSSTSGGWGSSSFRTTLNDTIYNTLPSNVKSLLQTNTVPYGTGGGDRVTTISTSKDKLFVPSLKELKNNSNYLYNTTTYTNWQPAEGTQFKWFAEDVNRIKPSSRTMTRSVPQVNRYCFIEANSTDANVIWLTTAETVAFCFVI